MSRIHCLTVRRTDFLRNEIQEREILSFSMQPSGLSVLFLSTTHFPSPSRLVIPDLVLTHVPLSPASRMEKDQARIKSRNARIQACLRGTQPPWREPELGLSKAASPIFPCTPISELVLEVSDSSACLKRAADSLAGS